VTSIRKKRAADEALLFHPENRSDKWVAKIEMRCEWRVYHVMP
jgi:hypothetical protein